MRGMAHGTFLPPKTKQFCPIFFHSMFQNLSSATQFLIFPEFPEPVGSFAAQISKMPFNLDRNLCLETREGLAKHAILHFFFAVLNLPSELPTRPVPVIPGPTCYFGSGPTRPRSPKSVFFCVVLDGFMISASAS